MAKFTKTLARKALHTISGSRKFYYRNVAKLATDTHGSSILELGSGKATKGKYTYSTKHLFPDDNDFMMSDLNPAFGHTIVDVTIMTYRAKFDVILCLNVLEHVYDTHEALTRLHHALKRKGTVVIAVPFAFPLHDEPGDFWRFTEHALRRLLDEHGFTVKTFKHNGKREMPFGYYIEAAKK